jgi:hypothetical protein
MTAGALDGADADVLSCPACGADVLETAASCDACGELLEPRDGVVDGDADDQLESATVPTTETTTGSLLTAKPTGVVRGLEEQRTAFGLTSRTFRLERYTDDGLPLPQIVIELRGRRFRGTLREADVVEVPRRVRLGKVTKVSRIANVRTGVEFRALGRYMFVKIVAVLLVLALTWIVVLQLSS